MGALMNACLNLVKDLLALLIKKAPDELLRFLALETFAFLARIHFLDLAIFDFFWPLQLFYIGSFSA